MSDELNDELVADLLRGRGWRVEKPEPDEYGRDPEKLEAVEAPRAEAEKPRESRSFAQLLDNAQSDWHEPAPAKDEEPLTPAQQRQAAEEQFGRSLLDHLNKSRGGWLGE